MIVQFKKNSSKPSTLTCIRADGSKTWTKLRHDFESHDLAHFAVESVLGFEHAFYGLLAQGFSVEDFELPKDQRPLALIPANLPLESLQTEHIVNLVTMPNGFINEMALVQELRNILAEKNLAFPENLTHEKMSMIIDQFNKLQEKWEILEEGGTLELVFDPTKC